MDRQTELLSFAQQYLQQGYSIVPLLPKEKRPCIPWSRYQDTKPTLEEIEKWFSQDPANIGIVTGKISGITVVDVDPKNGGKIEDFADIDTYQVATPSGGLHLYFQYNSEVKQTAGLTDGVDIRNDGGYVVAPPSLLENGSYKVTKALPIAEIPMRILEMQTEKQTAKHGNEHGDWTIAEGGLEIGNRNHSLARIAGKLFCHIPEDNWREVAVPLLEGWNASCNPPLEKDEFEKTVNNIANSERTKREEEITDTTSLTFHTANEILSMELEEPDWLWRGFVAKGLVTLIAGLPKDGKSTFIYAMLAKTQRGESFLERETKKSKVMILSEESSHDIKYRLMLQKVNTDDIIISDLTPRQNWKTWQKFIEEKILGQCKKQQIDMVVIDTLAEIWPVEKENEVGDIMKAFASLRALQREDLAVLLVHHLNKALADQGRGIRGSSAIAGATSINIEYGKPEGYPDTTQRKISCRGRYMYITPEQLIIDYNKFDGEYRVLGTEAQVVRQKKIDTILTILAEGKMSNIEIREHWPETEKAPDRTMLSRRLNALVKDGKIQEEKVEKNKKVFGLIQEAIQAEALQQFHQTMKAAEAWETSRETGEEKKSQVIEIVPAQFSYN